MRADKRPSGLGNSLFPLFFPCAFEWIRLREIVCPTSHHFSAFLINAFVGQPTGVQMTVKMLGQVDGHELRLTIPNHENQQANDSSSNSSPPRPNQIFFDLLIANLSVDGSKEHDATASRGTFRGKLDARRTPSGFRPLSEERATLGRRTQSPSGLRVKPTV